MKDKGISAAVKKAARKAATADELDEAWGIFKAEMHDQSRAILLGVLKGLKRDVSDLAPKATNGALKGQVKVVNQVIESARAYANQAETREDLDVAWQSRLPKAEEAVKRLRTSLSKAAMSRITGGNGNDTVSGGAGNDEIHGNNHDDTLYGNDGDDVLYGDNHNDVLDGGSGDDQLYGGNQDDILISGGGDDTMDGGNKTTPSGSPGPRSAASGPS